jgi:hypothetical protein
MGASNPHVAVVIDKTNGAMKLLLCLQFSNVLNCFNLLVSGFHTMTIDHIAKIL